MTKNNVDSKQIAVGLDIGTTKICSIVLTGGEKQGTYKIIGCASTQSAGVHRGVIANIEQTVNAIKQVIYDVEHQAGVKVSEVVVGIAGDHIDSLSTVSTVSISNTNQIVTLDDVNRAIEELRRSKISKDRRIIHIVPYEFIIDEQDGITQPVGMYGLRLQANVHIVTGKETAVRNIHLCVENAGLKVKSVILEPIASSAALLSEDEKEVGVCLIDIGGGTTDITIFKDNVLRFTSVIAIGGSKITDDVKQGFGTTKIEAERIKCDYGYTFKPSIMSKEEKLMIRGVGGSPHKEVNKEALCDIIQPRVEEIFEMCNEEIIKSGFANGLGAGIVLTGGSSLLKGVDELAQRIFNIPVKVGYPSSDKYLGLSSEIESPKYSTAVGLALFALSGDVMNGETTTELDEKDTLEVEEKIEITEEEQQTNKQSFIEKAKDFLTKL
jgi:cell division protein FtsA